VASNGVEWRRVASNGVELRLAIRPEIWCFPLNNIAYLITKIKKYFFKFLKIAVLFYTEFCYFTRFSRRKILSSELCISRFVQPFLQSKQIAV
jgi:hypothetical protein